MCFDAVGCVTGRASMYRYVCGHCLQLETKKAISVTLQAKNEVTGFRLFYHIFCIQNTHYM